MEFDFVVRISILFTDVVKVEVIEGFLCAPRGQHIQGVGEGFIGMVCRLFDGLES